MILAAGRGTRLRPLTDTVPKPLISLHGQALIAHQLGWLRDAGITEIVVNLHHLGRQIEAAIGDGSDLGVEVHYSHEAQVLETGGGIRHALPLLGDEPFAILNGDVWTDFDFQQLPTVLNSDSAHLILVDRPAHREQGDFQLTDNRVRRSGQRPMVYCGISVLNPSLFADTPADAVSLRDLLFQAADAGQVSGTRFAGTWIDIGSPEQLAAARQLRPGTDQPPAA
jgi:MurNAc alpha-1-phosphate uridylyltransferase